MLQWRRWCLNPDYRVGEGGAPLRARYASVRFPILSLSITDDELMTARNTESLHGFYASAPRRDASASRRSDVRRARDRPLRLLSREQARSRHAVAAGRAPRVALQGHFKPPQETP